MSLFLMLLGCPTVEEVVLRVDLEARRATFTYQGLGSTSAAEADADFLTLLETREGEEFAPGLPIVRAELVEAGERLDGVVEVAGGDAMELFTTGLGLFRYDRKSPWVWCAEDGDEVVSTDGVDALPLDECVAWDRKRDTLEVTVRSLGAGTDHPSLLPQFRRWKAGETLVPTPPPAPVPVRAAVSLPGGQPAPEAITAYFSAQDASVCAPAGGAGATELVLGVDGSGAVSRVGVSGELAPPALVSCLSEHLGEWVLPAEAHGATLVWSLAFGP